MGNICCCKKRTKKKIVLLLVGLDNAGKTAAAKGLAGEPINSVVPTVGFSVINLSYLQYIVKVFDLGGGPNIRGIWNKYFVDAHGVIFVVDSSDICRLDEAKEVLRELLSHEKISRKPVLVLANKQDNENALDEVDIIEKLELEALVNGNECPTLVESCSATESSGNLKIDPGIKKGYEWLINYIIRNYEILNKRVEEDVLQQITLENRLRTERIEKIRALKEAEQKMKREDEDAIESYSNYERKINGQLQEQAQVNVENSRSNDSDASEDSSDSFPPVYHIKEDILLERPKSAVQIVRQQLELNTPNKKSFISRASNKTVPLHLYGIQVPRSASAERKIYEIERRNLKSAGDAPFRITELPNVPMLSGDELHSEIYSLMNFESTTRVRSSGDVPKENESSLPWFHKTKNGDINGISVVNIDL